VVAAKTAETTEAAEPAEYENVIGRRQLSSLLFVATVVIVTFSAVSYPVAGRSLPRSFDAAAPDHASRRSADSDPLKTAIAPRLRRGTTRVFADPLPRKTYIQIGAARGRAHATTLRQLGLRRRGLDGLNRSRSPNESCSRVLIGPFADEAAYKRVQKNQVDQSHRPPRVPAPLRTRRRGRPPYPQATPPRQPLARKYGCDQPPKT
jgi:cell division septation protein DedD